MSCSSGIRRCGWTSFSRPSSRWKRWLLPVVQLVEGAQHDLQETGEVLFGEEHGGAGGAGALVGGDLQQLGRFAAQLRHQQQLRR